MIWYSPSIFLWPCVWVIKRIFRNKAYLILRDIFPDWAFDIGVIKNRFVFTVLSLVASMQYIVADRIGIQSNGNSRYFLSQPHSIKSKVEVLNNWLIGVERKKSRIRISETILAGRKVFLYAGNMGKAQGVDALIDLVNRFKAVDDIGFLFVGRGTEVQRIRDNIVEGQLKNILVFDEIDHAELCDLCMQCVGGLVCLDAKHQSHNIPENFSHIYVWFADYCKNKQRKRSRRFDT